MDVSPDELSVEQGYTLWAPLYDDDGNPLTAIEGPVIRSWIGRPVGEQALDLGCGTGRHTEALARAGADVCAADLTIAMMEQARLRLGHENRRIHWLRTALPGPLPFANGAFTIVVMGLVAEHLADLNRSLAEVARVLRPGGRLLLSTLHPDRTRAGQRARFIDPETGVRRPIQTFHREIDDYLASAAMNHFELMEQLALYVSEELAASLPRAQPYLGIPLGWAAIWERSAL